MASELLKRLGEIGKRGQPSDTAGRAKVMIEAELKLPNAQLWVARFNHQGPNEYLFCRRKFYWVDLCLTPRRPDSRARYLDHWGPHRFGSMGAIIAFPPGFKLHLKNEGGQHISLICALAADAVDRWLPDGFDWTDRRLEACLNIASSEIRTLLVRLSQEVLHPGVAGKEICDALVLILSVEIARTLTAMEEPARLGGLAAWRMRVIEKRLAEPGEIPTLAELAARCDLSVRQLTRGFRTSRGCSIGDYIAQHRIEVAKRRLATDESLKSIANATGFSSQSTFTYAFRRATGVTPLVFRQRMLRGIKQNAPAA
ncbi:MAG: helix-turn-helix transcriptional regulator [Blastomonas fulva]|uniref:helix-turn-helix domain-containing protein n=1 Tax=Blastomonas fulva TaxID=1550728 RepID=UPI0024E1E794|nr:AraC family transcriptional regulator [Blastomonas fulva]MDK2755199.1 helix-turn-helix transcriptional regulator [Blastomonas fulva]